MKLLDYWRDGIDKATGLRFRYIGKLDLYKHPYRFISLEDGTSASREDFELIINYPQREDLFSHNAKLTNPEKGD